MVFSLFRFNIVGWRSSPIDPLLEQSVTARQTSFDVLVVVWVHDLEGARAEQL